MLQYFFLFYFKFCPAYQTNKFKCWFYVQVQIVAAEV